MSRLSVYEILTRLRKRRVTSSENLDLAEKAHKPPDPINGDQARTENGTMFWVENESNAQLDHHTRLQESRAKLARRFGIRWRKNVRIPREKQNDQPIPENFLTQEALNLDFGDILEDLARSRKSVGPLEIYLNLMETIGVSRYRREEYPKRDKLAQHVLKAVFWAFTLLAMANNVLYLKYQIANAMRTPDDLTGCVLVGFALLPCFNRPLVVRLLAFSQEKMSIMLLNIRKMFQLANGALREQTNKCTKASGLLALGTITLTVTTTVFSFTDLTNWSFREALVSRAFIISVDLTAWGSKNHSEAIAEDLYEKYYLGNVTAASATLGAASAAIHFCSILQGEAIRDLIILAVLVLNSAWNLFDRMIQPHFLGAASLIPADQLTKCLELYKAIRQAGDSINNTLGTVFKFVVMQDLFQYAYPFAQALTGKDADMTVYHTMVDLVKTTLVFFISLKIQEKNQSAGKWLRRLTAYVGPVDIPSILDMTVEAAIDDLNQCPTGFGAGYFFVTESFLVSYFTMILSCIALMVDAPKKTN